MTILLVWLAGFVFMSWLLWWADGWLFPREERLQILVVAAVWPVVIAILIFLWFRFHTVRW